MAHMSKKPYDKKTIGLQPRVFKKNRQWAVDQDYGHTLSREHQEWLSKFLCEYYNGYVKKGDPNALHNTDELRLDCYDRNNKFNNDVSSILNLNTSALRTLTGSDNFISHEDAEKNLEDTKAQKRGGKKKAK